MSYRLFVSVGSALTGFDELVSAVDHFCASHPDCSAYGQIGHSTVEPAHFQWERLLSRTDMQKYIAASDVVLCHAGLGILGDALRAEKPVIAMPRLLDNTSNSPGNNQAVFAERMQQLHGIHVCRDEQSIQTTLEQLIRDGVRSQRYQLKTNIPTLIADWLRQSER